MAKYFSAKELSCRCCQQDKTTQKLQDTLDSIRTRYGKPITLSNAYRCPVHNKAVGGALKSKHMFGQAADLVRNEELLKLIQDNLEQLGLWMEHPDHTPSWIHIQVVPYPGWLYGMPRTFKP